MNFILTHWPLTIVCAAMILAAVIDGWKLKVPNWLTFPLILSGWLLGLLNNFGLLEAAGFEGGIGGALAGTAVGFVLLFPVYSIGGMGAGDVKMQMGFGSWIGAFYGYKEGMPIIWWAFVFGARCRPGGRERWQAQAAHAPAALRHPPLPGLHQLPGLPERLGVLSFPSCRRYGAGGLGRRLWRGGPREPQTRHVRYNRNH